MSNHNSFRIEDEANRHVNMAYPISHGWMAEGDSQDPYRAFDFLDASQSNTAGTALPLASIPAPTISTNPTINDAPSESSCFLDDMKTMVIDMCKDILTESASEVMKVTELSAIVSSYVGSEITEFIQENYDGLLFLLKNNPNIFRVQNTAVGSTVSLISRSFNNQISLTPNAFPSNERYSQTCLHIGNVPPNMGEIQLQREFEQFGPVESVNIYTQRPRKFAFVSFFSAEDAAQAKHVLSKKFPWKSAISFARKENPAKLKTMYGVGNTPQFQIGLAGIHNDYSPSNSTSGSSTPRSPIAYDNYGSAMNINENSKIIEEKFPIGKLLRGTSASSIGSNYSNYNNINNTSNINTTFYQGNRPRSLGSDRGMFGKPNHKATFPGGSTSSHHRQFHGHIISDMNTPMNVPFKSHSDLGMTMTDMIDSMTNLEIKNYEHRNIQGDVATTSGNEPDVLRKLCDMTQSSMGPLKQWSINMTADFPVCDVIINILQEFGGIIPLSDLTLLLSHRLPVPHIVNVKTLKAFLEAYPGFYKLSAKDDVILCL